MSFRLIVTGLILLIVVGVGTGLYSVKEQEKPITSNEVPGASASDNKEQVKTASEPIIDDFEGVQVAAIWEKNKTGSDTQNFTVQLNNHAYDLDDFNFTENIALEINGQVIESKVIKVQQSGAGHHVGSQVQIQGAKITQLKVGDKLTLVVNNVLNTPSRRFTWLY